MCLVHHQILSESYLLVLAPGAHADEPEDALAQGLSRASRSGKPAVWVDCGQLPRLSPEATMLLWAYHYKLQQQNVPLVLARAAPEIQGQLEGKGQRPGLRMVPSLSEAALG